MFNFNRHITVQMTRAPQIFCCFIINIISFGEDTIYTARRCYRITLHILTFCHTADRNLYQFQHNKYIKHLSRPLAMFYDRPSNLYSPGQPFDGSADFPNCLKDVESHMCWLYSDVSCVVCEWTYQTNVTIMPIIARHVTNETYFRLCGCRFS